MTITVVATLHAHTQHVDTLLNELRTLIQHSRKDGGCQAYDLYRDSENQDVFVFIEKWQDQDSLTQHMQTEHFSRFSEQAKTLLKDLSIKQLSAVDV